MVSDDRGQAFTLEGFIAAVLILSAVLFALQASVLTPTTGGSVDSDVQADVRQQTEDILAASASSGDLSYLVRHWNDDCNELTFAGATSEAAGFGAATPPTRFGVLMNQTFNQRGRAYNVVVTYHRNVSTPGTTRTRALVRRGVAPDTAIAASYTITLYDDQRLTASDSVRLGTAYKNCKGQPGGFPIPDAAPNSSIYNVVEIEVVVW